VYTWLRIVGESTFILHDFTSAGFQEKIEMMIQKSTVVSSVSSASEQNAVLADGHPQLDDFLRVETHGPDSDLHMGTSKDQVAGLRDIHLSDLREWPKTLYMDIHGIPEDWLSLVSQTTRVANIIDFLGLSVGDILLSQDSQRPSFHPAVACQRRHHSTKGFRYCTRSHKHDVFSYAVASFHRWM
jgi:arginine metabolism regulation protein II